LSEVNAIQDEIPTSMVLSKQSKVETSIAVVVPIESATEADNYLRDKGVEFINIEADGTPKELLSKAKEDKKAALDEIESAKKGLTKIFKSDFSKLLAMEELLQLEKDRCEIFYSCGRTQKTVLLRLWVPKTKSEEVEKIIHDKTKGTAFIKNDKEPEDAPVLLDNPPLVKPFESLVNLFGTPRYNEIDPTIFILFTFPLFFGIMLTDAVYGAVLIALGIFISKKYANYSRMAKSAGVILGFSGAFAVLFGILTGSYMGDLVATYILGLPNGSQDIALWIDPLFEANAIVFLLVMILMGFIHIFAGYALGAYDALKKGNKKLAMTHFVSWYIMLIGGLLIGGSMFPENGPMLPDFFTYIGAGLLGIGVVLQYMGKKAMFLLDVIGIVGNSLSYARLLAMGLTTAGIALSFNVLAGLTLEIPVIGIVIAAIVFLLGHVINILLNTLGAFIHSLRLQYVEWFGTFYEGGGVMFNPFKENRKYTVLRK